MIDTITAAPAPSSVTAKPTAALPTDTGPVVPKASIAEAPATDIVLATINAKYIHTAFGLRWLRENLGPLRERSLILEFTNRHSARDMAERILTHRPRIIGLGVYIWNVTQTTALVGVLKEVAPDVIVVLGGPEVSYEIDAQRICVMADHVVIGEGEDTFRILCEGYLSPALDGAPTPPKIIAQGMPELSTLRLPYDAYTDEDLSHRVLYVEASRGCPFRCEFCLSSLDQSVRPFPLDAFLGAMDRLLDRGALGFKFVDRTFNLKVDTSARILRFFLDRMRPGLAVHFEMIPDRLPAALRELLKEFPPGTLQLEIGIQSLDPEVGARISRRQHQGRMADNFQFLHDATHAHVHADLIIGLPGEDAAGFAAGFNRLHAMGPEEIQLGVLKRLRGTPIIRHTNTFGLRFHPEPPYEVLQTAAIDFLEMQHLKRFAQLWDVVVNRGNYLKTAPMLWEGTQVFAGFMAFYRFAIGELGQVHAIALDRMTAVLFPFLVDVRGRSEDDVRSSLQEDYLRGNRKLPRRFRPFKTLARKSRANRRQRLHAAEALRDAD